MKQRTTYILLALFVALAAVVFLMIQPAGERETSYAMPDVHFSVDSARIQAITITRAGNTFSIQNIGGTWFVVLPTPLERRYRADDAAVRQLLGAIHNVKATSLISSNPEKQSLFQVDSSGTQLSIAERDGKKTEFVVGKMGPSFAETYVRPVASGNVYLAAGLSAWEVNKEVKDWRDRKIIHIGQDSVKRLVYRYPKDQFTLTRDSVWRLQKSPVVSQAMKEVLSSLGNLWTDEFVDTAVRLPARQLRIELYSPELIMLDFFPAPPDSSKYWIRSSASPEFFLTRKHSVNPILKGRKEFLGAKK